MDIKKTARRIKKLIGGEPGFYQIVMSHEENCPTLKTNKMRDCTCEPKIRRMGKDKHAGKSGMAS